MVVHRKRFRIEEVYNGGTPIIAADDDAASMPMHREIMAELRAIREQMGTPHRPGSADAIAADVESTNREVADAQALLHVHVLATTMVDAGYGELTQSQVNDADAALLACYARGQSGGGWQLDQAGFDALAVIVNVYDEQLQCAPFWVLTEASERLERMSAGGAGQAPMRKQA